MSATYHTTNYSLPQFVGSDIPSWLGDFNGAMTSIDTNLFAVQQNVIATQNVITSYGTAEPSGVPSTGNGTIYIKIEE